MVLLDRVGNTPSSRRDESNSTRAHCYNMADEVELPENRSWPAPPPFYQQFTQKNIDRLKELKASALGDAAKDKPLFDSASLRSIQVPDELRQLVPPAPPAEGKYRVFAELQDTSGVNRTLQDVGVDQLYPSHSQILPLSSQPVDTEWTVDRVYYLKKIVHSLMIAFTQLIGVLHTDSSQQAELLQNIVVLFYNAHQLINDYRIHQARETLILLMEAQLEKKRADVAEIWKMKGKIDEILEGLKDSAGPDSTALAISNATPASLEAKKRKGEQRKIWQALDTEMKT